MCICDLKVNEEKRICDGDWNTLYIERNEDGYSMIAIGEGCVYMKINYCPKCGRSLES